MTVKKFRARTMRDALQMVRDELGPDAAVLETREIAAPVLKWFLPRKIEVTAAANVRVPSRFDEPARPAPQHDSGAIDLSRAATTPPATPSLRFNEQDPRDEFAPHVSPAELHRQLNSLKQMVEGLCQGAGERAANEIPETCFRLFTDLIDAELSEDVARELIHRVCEGRPHDDETLLKARICRLIEEEIQIGGAIKITPGKCRVVALLGPTGVGKTTTIAKLAANFHLRERVRVGLITVDTYRIAAVEQLRTYADIIDLPMEVVATPREMRQAVDHYSDLDLVLLDTAGRSPRDEVRIQELKSMLAEARVDEAHLVLSSVASAASLQRTAERFVEAGATSLLLTKLDEATGFGALLPLLRGCNLPLSYLTNGQNVPDDIEAAEKSKVARLIVGQESM
ncbi:MAG: flagellar biosynthesis protein FlhF [Planctomycetales bacterium]|nr:flagellar biosynthesis protein FlhF [Planctomycetales bacterium]